MNKVPLPISLHKIFVLLAISLLLIQCKGRKDNQLPTVDPAFVGYITAYTSGVISNRSTIRVELREDVPGIELNQKIDGKIFSFSPSIKGETYWTDSRTIEFKPDEILPSGKLFDGKFHLSKILEVPDKLKTLEFQFQTRQQLINVEYEGLTAYDSKDLKWQQLTGSLNTSDFADDIKIEEMFTAIQNSKKLKIHWEHSVDGNGHKFQIDSISRTESKSEVILEWKGKLIQSEDDGEQIIDIPPLGDFKVMNFRVKQQPEQMITLYFSDPLSENQDLTGLIHLKSGEEIRIVKNGNEVNVFPRTRLVTTTDIIVEDGVRNSMGYQLSERFVRSITFSSIKPSVSLIGDGVILPSSDGLIFPFKAVNLSAVNVKIIKIFENNIIQFFQRNQFNETREMKRVGRIVFKKEVPLLSDKNIDYGQMNTFALDLSGLIKVEPGAIYRVHISFDMSQSLYACPGENSEEDDYEYDTGTDPEMESYDNPDYDYYYYDEDYYYDYYDEYNWRERDDPCKKSYYMRNDRSVARNVFASDLGIIAKGGNSKSFFVAVTDLRTTEPLSGIDIEVYNYQQQLINSGTTDSKGMARIDLESKPFLIVAKQGDQRGYLRVDDGSALSMSMFDIGGQQSQKGIKGFIYGERGVWRPGDSIFLSFILEDKNKVLPKEHPVVFELFTPENQLYLRKIKTSSLNGFYDFRTATTQDAPTGNWLAKVKVGASNFTKTIKIETVKPNRLKIKIDFHSDVLKSAEPSVGDLEVKWLHGATAKNLKADVNVTLSSGQTKFDKYPGYIFDSPIRSFETEEISLFDGSLDEQGKAIIKADFDVNKNAPGMIKANFVIRAFEKGGDFSIDRFTIPYSPFSSYAGLKVPEGQGWYGALYTDKPNLIPIVTVDESGNPIDRDKVKIEIYDIRWRWWWERNEEEDLARYIQNRSSSLIKTDYVDTRDGKAIYEMKIPQSWGRKLIIVTDPVSKHSAGQLFYTSYSSWWNNARGNNPGGAEMLIFKTDKSSYNVGEDVKIELPKSEIGKALVSIESGSKVIDVFWVVPDGDNHSFSFKTTEAMAPNVYVNIAYLQPHNQMKNDMPIRLYGVQNISVEDPKTHLEPVITMPDILAPEESFNVKVQEKNGRKMTYTLAIVDEGLLDLTRFKTPDPWSNFYVREALGVKTWDMYKYVMGAFTGELSGLLAIGGDEEIGPKEGQKANRFKPVVYFMGPFELKSGSKTHKIHMANYVGSVRTMVVAGQDGAYGKTEKTTPVKKPLMVLSTLPRVLGPTETVKLPVTVFAMDDAIRKVTVEVKTNELIKVIGSSRKSIDFTEQGEQVVYFDLEVNPKIGIGKVEVNVKSGKETASHAIELDVRLPNPQITQVSSGMADPGKKWTGEYQPFGVEGTNKGTVEISTIPAINLEKRLQYLIQYPHGCIEQTTSSVFPQLYLKSLLELSSEEKKDIENNIIAGVNRLKSFQLSNGGLSYWPGYYEEANDWGTNYAGHFMLEAKKLGYSLPIGFLENWLKYQQNKANNWAATALPEAYRYRSDQLIQAYRLYTLALAGKPAMGAMNRMREMRNLSIAAKWRLAAAYALAGRENIARDIIKGLDRKVEAYKELSYSYGSDIRDQAMILETLTLLDEKVMGKSVLDELTEHFVSDRWYSTQTTAYSLMAIAKFIGHTGPGNAQSLKLVINGKSTDVSMKSPIYQHELDLSNMQTGKIEVQNTGDITLFIKVNIQGIPLVGNQTSDENDLSMEITYKDLSGNPISPQKLTQGTDFLVEVRIHHPGYRADYKEMALTQIFPSGWEIRNLRMEEGPSVYTKDIPTYQDIRDDRVYTYFDIRKNKYKTFVVLLNASYLGKFYLPTVSCEAMYDNEINSSKAGMWVEVVDGGQ